MILEPVRRDSGPAIAAGAAFAQNRASGAIVLALAADHVVQNNAAFVAACREGLTAANAGRIVTFGVKPERPATEYGYINPGEVISGEVHAVTRILVGLSNSSVLDHPSESTTGRVLVCWCSRKIP